MFAAMGLASYTASEADDLRKAISKKKAEAIQKHRQKFIDGACKRGIPQETASAIFEDWENFARYGFNKSHAADYGVIAVETAFLKTHYTVEYMTALLSASKNETEKVAFYVADCQSMGVDVLPPDINASEWDFSIEDRPDENSAIRFGLGAVKNVGLNPVTLIMDVRKEGRFTDLTDFAHRVDLRQVGKRSLECMIKVGALDGFGDRKALLEGLDKILAVSASHFKAALSGQLSFFGGAQGMEEQIYLPPAVGVDRREQLEWEKELIGLYVSDHPLSAYMPVLKQKISHFSGQLGETRQKETVTVAGLVTRFRAHQTKKGKPMGFATLEDIQGNIELVIFPRAWDKYGDLLTMDAVLTATGQMDNEGGDPKILVEKMEAVTLDEITDILQNSVEGFSEFPLMAQEVDGVSPAASPSTGGIAGNPAGDEFNTLPDNPPDWDDLTPPPEPDDWHLLECPGGYAEGNSRKGKTGPVEMSLAGIPSLPVERVTASSDARPAPPLPPVVSNSFSSAPQAVKEPMPVAAAYIVPPLAAGGCEYGKKDQAGPDQPRMLTITLRSSGDKARDVRRMRNLYGLILSCPGKDRFAFVMFENGQLYQVEFPNETTGITPELVRRLEGALGTENVRVEVIKFL